MNRLIAGIFAATIALVGCAGAPTTSPLASAAAGAALEELCGTDETSLSAIATALGQVNETTDTTALSTAIGTAMTNLTGLAVDVTALPLRDAALTALQQVQSALADPATRTQVAAQAATAIRALDSEICA